VFAGLIGQLLLVAEASLLPARTAPMKSVLVAEKLAVFLEIESAICGGDDPLNQCLVP
jgi:hypothetical protein